MSFITFSRFLPDKDSVQRVRRTFTGLYTLDLVTTVPMNFNQSISQSINQSINQSISQSINRSVSQSINQSIINQSINRPANLGQIIDLVTTVPIIYVLKSFNQSVNESMIKSTITHRMPQMTTSFPGFSPIRPCGAP